MVTGTEGPLAWKSSGPYAVIAATISPSWTDNPAGSYTGGRGSPTRRDRGLGRAPTARPVDEKSQTSWTMPFDGCGEQSSRTTASGAPSPSTSPLAVAVTPTS